jgi:hypothetical protein
LQRRLSQKICSSLNKRVLQQLHTLTPFFPAPLQSRMHMTEAIDAKANAQWPECSAKVHHHYARANLTVK